MLLNHQKEKKKNQLSKCRLLAESIHLKKYINMIRECIASPIHETLVYLN
jgi:hypothetical protein